MAVHIDIFSDVVCPWCLIGKLRLEEAIRGMADAPEISIRWLPFELNPNMPKDGMDRRAYRTAKFGSMQASDELDQRLQAAAEPLGVRFNFEEMHRTPSSFDAHRLIMAAQSVGLGHHLKSALLDRYFLQAKDIGDRAVLLEACAAVGINPDSAVQVLDSDQLADDVRAFEAEAQRLGVSGVPFFIFNGQLGLSGAQPPEVFQQALREADQIGRPDATAGDRDGTNTPSPTTEPDGTA